MSQFAVPSRNIVTYLLAASRNMSDQKLGSASECSHLTGNKYERSSHWHRKSGNWGSLGKFWEL